MGLEEQVRATLRAEVDRAPAWSPDLTSIRRAAKVQTRRRVAASGFVAVLATLVVTATGVLDTLPRVDTAPPVVDPDRTPTALRLIGQDRPVPPGRYSAQITGIDPEVLWVQLDVPPGFRTWEATVRDNQMHVAAPAGGAKGSIVGLSLWTVSGVNPDPCHGDALPAYQVYRDPGPTTADLATALIRQPHRVGKPPRPVSFGGYEGMYLELGFPDRFDPAECATGAYEAWVSVDPRTHGRTERSWYAPGSVDRIWILDVHGLRVVVNAYLDAGASDEAVAALDSMLESLEIRAGDAG